MKRGASRVPLFLTAIAVLVLVGVVVVASSGSTPSASDDTRQPWYVLFDTIFSLSLVAVLASAAFIVYALAHRSPRENLRTRGGLASVVALVALAAVLGTVDVRAWLLSHPSEVEEPPATSATANASENGAEPADRPHFAWLPVTVILALAAIGVGAYVLAERRRRAPLAPDDAVVAQELADILDDSLDDLRAESDPRRAVIAAYARLEQALGASGLPRRQEETAGEYVTRILDRLEVERSPVRRLSDLFTYAKFSHHEVSTAMKEEAIAALARIRDELRAAARRRAEERSVALTPENEQAAAS